MAIPIEALRKVKTIVTHDKCADGIVSALLLMDALSEQRPELKFIQYGSPSRETLAPAPGQLFCDMTPPEASNELFVAAGAIVLDHHRGAQGLVEAHGDLGAYSDAPGVSGAVLAYREVWLPMKGGTASDLDRDFWENLARLAGVYDTWQKQDPDWAEACDLREGLLFLPMADWQKMTVAEFRSTLNRLRWVGPIQTAKHRHNCQRAIDGAFRFVTPKGVRVAVFQGTKLANEASELAKDADLCLGFDIFVEEGLPKLVVSARSRTDYDCLGLAKDQGGGGHSKAAGFRIIGPNLNPYDLLQAIVLGFEHGGTYRP